MSRVRSAPSASAISRSPRCSARKVVSLRNVLQPPYNLFARGIEAEIFPLLSSQRHFATLGYGALCRGLLSGRMRPDTLFQGDDLAARRSKVPTAASLRSISMQ